MRNLTLSLALFFSICSKMIGQVKNDRLDINGTGENVKILSGYASGAGFLQFRNYPLIDLLNNLLDDKSTIIDIPNSSIRNKIIDLSIRKDSILLNDSKSMIMDSLLKSNNLTAYRKVEKVSRWVLSVDDNNILKSLVVKDLVPGVISSSSLNGYIYTCVNNDINQITNALASIIKEPIESRVYEPYKYSMSINVFPTSKLVKDLRQKGLKLEKQMIEVQKLIIE